MTGRERLLTAINNEKPDRLPCLIHCWIDYHLKTYMGGMDQHQAYEAIGMDPVIYTGPEYIFSDKDLANWQSECKDQWEEADGTRHWRTVITTPDGVLSETAAANQYTSWTTDFLIKNEHDFEIWEKWVPLPERADWTWVRDHRERVGDRGIIRGYAFDFGQLSPWQTFSTILYGAEASIMACIDQPAWMHHVMQTLLDKKLTVLDRLQAVEFDLVESGGGGGSASVISPAMHKEFCLPYDLKQHLAIKAYGPKIVYHLCGKLMPMLELMTENGSDGLETMTPPGMGGDADLCEADRRVGDKLFFIGGFDQNAGFEQGNPEIIRQMVFDLHACRPNGGYICAPSDQFFHGSIENLRAFADACRECTY